MLKYVFTFILTSISLIFIILFINLIVDPLWYFNGNKINKINYAYDERLSKTIRFSKVFTKYDCIMFGNSVSTVLHSKHIVNNDCFNFAFSAGGINEYKIYLNYFKKIGFSPKVIYVEQSAGLYRDFNNTKNLPKFVKEGRLPDHFLTNYLLFSTFSFSIKSIFGISPYLQAYDNEFEGFVRKNNLKYLPNKNLSTLNKNENKQILPNLKLHKELKKVFPNAKVIGWVQPISAWQVYHFWKSGILENILNNNYKISKIYDAFYDFSIPNQYTKNKDMTYDGSHYYEVVLNSIAKVISSENTNSKFYLSSKEKYEKIFIEELINFEIEYQ